MLTVYAREWCPYCIRTKQILEKGRYRHKMIYPNDEEIILALKEKYDQNTLPIIVFKDKNTEGLVGGSTELPAFLKKYGNLLR